MCKACSTPPTMVGSYFRRSFYYCRAKLVGLRRKRESIAGQSQHQRLQHRSSPGSPVTVFARFPHRLPPLSQVCPCRTYISAWWSDSSTQDHDQARVELVSGRHSCRQGSGCTRPISLTQHTPHPRERQHYFEFGTHKTERE